MSMNGRLLPSELVAVQGAIRLAPTTARAWVAAVADAAADRVSMSIAVPDGGYRDIPTQEDMHDRPWLHNLNPANKIALAPVGQSSHGFGTVVDVAGGNSAVAWMLKHGAAYGFRRPSAADPNHFSHNGLLTPAVLSRPNPIKITAPRQRGDIDMRAIYIAGSQNPEEWAIIAGADSRWIDVKKTDDLADLQAVQNLLGADGNTTTLPGGNDAPATRVRVDRLIQVAKRSVAGGTAVVDMDSVTAAAKAGAADGVASLVVPTAAENGQAARDAIVK